MDEESLILVTAILFCLVVMTTCAGVCSSMQKHKRADVVHVE
jgi:hypothetical protein